MSSFESDYVQGLMVTNSNTKKTELNKTQLHYTTVQESFGHTKYTL